MPYLQFLFNLLSSSAGRHLAQDPVYGQVQLTGGVLLDVMDTQPFQRLRELCQLGTSKCAGCKPVRESCANPGTNPAPSPKVV